MARTWPGTICHLQAVPYDDILVWPVLDPVSQTMQSNILLKPGKSWNIIKLISQNNAFSEQSSFTPAGIKWDQQVKGYLFGQSELNHLQVNNWSLYRWVIIAREVGSEINYLVGNRFRGAAISVTYDNSSTTLTTIQFDHQSVSRAILYKGTLIQPPGGSTPSGSGAGAGFSAGSPIQFLVGDPGTIAHGGTTYTNAALIGENVLICVDGQALSQVQLADRFSCSFNNTTGEITFSAPVFQGQLIQIFF